jgi:hypothetical protein
MAKKSKRRPWTPVQVRTLKTLAKKKTRAASIAKTLKRTEGATRQKAFSLDCHSTPGLKLRTSKARRPPALACHLVINRRERPGLQGKCS